MNKVIEMLMEELGVGICEDFRVKPSVAGQSECKGIYHFDELGVLRRDDGTPKDSVLGFLARGRLSIEKVEPKGRYIPKNGEYFWYVTTYGFILKDRFINEQNKYAIEHNIVFRTEEEAKDYKWFLDQVDKYKKEFITGQPNYRLCFDFEYNKLFMVQNDHIKHHKDYFGNIENIKEFRNIAGDDRIKKYMFGVYE